MIAVLHRLMATKPGAAYGDLLQSVLADSHFHSLCMFGDIDAHCFVLYIHIYMCIYIYIFIYIYTHAYIYIYTHIYIHILYTWRFSCILLRLSYRATLATKFLQVNPTKIIINQPYEDRTLRCRVATSVSGWSWIFGGKKSWQTNQSLRLNMHG